jgi:tyrosinase
MAIRKNQATLSTDEKSRFVAAVLVLKANGKYDQYVREHRDSMQGSDHWAHRGPAFFPWHREFLKRFELDLQSVHSNVTLPYWDWSVDNSPISSIWNPDFMGGNGRTSDRKVMDGPFAFDAGNFRLNVVPAPPEERCTRH